MAHKTTRPVDGSQKVCYVGMAPSSSKVCADNRSAPVNFALAWLTKGLLRWNSKFYPRVATKQRPATLEWQLLPLSFNLARLTKSLQRWNGFLFKILPSGGSQKVCYLGVALSSSKFYRQGGSQKRCATCGGKRSATVLHRMYDQIPKSPLTRLASKVQTQGPEDQDEGPEDQGTRGPRDQTTGPEDQGTRGPRDQGTKGQRDQRTKRPGNQQTRTKGVGKMLFLIRINVFFDRNQFSV